MIAFVKAEKLNIFLQISFFSGSRLFKYILFFRSKCLTALKYQHRSV